MKTEPHKICSAESCENDALSFSQPPLCLNHIGDIDDWYDHVRETLEGSELDENVRMLYRLLAHSEYMAAISNNPVDEELYKDFVGRAEPPEAVAFSVDHFVTALANFYITVAVSGILGNFSYDALKIGVLQIMSLLHSEPKPDDDQFEEIVEREKYEETRQRFHLKMPFLEIDRETEKKIGERYRNIVQEGFEKNPELLFRPKKKGKK